MQLADRDFGDELSDPVDRLLISLRAYVTRAPRKPKKGRKVAKSKQAGATHAITIRTSRRAIGRAELAYREGWCSSAGRIGPHTVLAGPTAGKEGGPSHVATDKPRANLLALRGPFASARSLTV